MLRSSFGYPAHNGTRCAHGFLVFWHDTKNTFRADLQARLAHNTAFSNGDFSSFNVDHTKRANLFTQSTAYAFFYIDIHLYL
jgi:hypothetical protein